MNNFFSGIQQLIDTGILFGMATGIIQNNHPLSCDYRGRWDETSTPVSQHDVYDIASLTKLFTATRILQLIEQRKLSFDMPVHTVLPEFINKEITIEALLLHRSGMAPSVFAAYRTSAQTIVGSIMNCADHSDIRPVQTVYSCINFILLGLIIASVDGSLDQGFQTHLFHPLGLTDTGFNPQDPRKILPTEISSQRGRIQGIVHDSTALALGGVAGNAGLFSTLDDLMVFIGEGYFNEKLLSHETLTLISTTNISNRSYGWNRHPFSEKSFLFHTGFTGPSIIIDLEHRHALILLTNRTYPSRNNTAYLEARLTLFDSFLSKILI